MSAPPASLPTIIPPPPTTHRGACDSLQCFSESVRTAAELLTRARTLPRALNALRISEHPRRGEPAVVLLLPEASRVLYLALEADGLPTLRSAGMGELLGGEVTVVACPVSTLTDVAEGLLLPYRRNAAAIDRAWRDAAVKPTETLVALVTRFNVFVTTVPTVTVSGGEA